MNIMQVTGFAERIQANIYCIMGCFSLLGAFFMNGKPFNIAAIVAVKVLCNCCLAISCIEPSKPILEKFIMLGSSGKFCQLYNSDPQSNFTQHPRIIFCDCQLTRKNLHLGKITCYTACMYIPHFVLSRLHNYSYSTCSYSILQ